MISRSPADVQPVFAAIVDSAGRLCGAESAVVFRFVDDQAQFAASYNFTSETVEAYRRRSPGPCGTPISSRGSPTARCASISPTLEADPRMSDTVKEIYRTLGACEARSGCRWSGRGR